MKTKAELLQLEIELAQAERYLNTAGFADWREKRTAENAVSNICAQMDSASMLKSETKPGAWDEIYKLDDFAETMDRGGIWVSMMEEDDPGALWESVGVCIASNFQDAWGGTDAPKSKVEVDFDTAPYVEYADYANIIVVDRLSSPENEDHNEKMLVINTLTGESFAY